MIRIRNKTSKPTTSTKTTTPTKYPSSHSDLNRLHPKNQRNVDADPVQPHLLHLKPQQNALPTPQQILNSPQQNQPDQTRKDMEQRK